MLDQIYFSANDTGIFGSLFRIYYFIFYVLLCEIINSKQFYFTIKRIFLYFIFIFILPSLIAWNHIGFYLDDILFINWKTCVISKPLFIIGNARSGTTWMHRLLMFESSLDSNTTTSSEIFTSLKTWEILFAVSITWRYLFHTLYVIDKRFLFSFFYNSLMMLEIVFLGSMTSRKNSVHPIGLMLAEEDEWLMIHIAFSQLILFFFPLGSQLLHPIIMFDYQNDTMLSSSRSLLPQELKKSIFLYYKQCIQRHLYYYESVCHHRKNKSNIPIKLVFISKNPAFTLRLQTIPSIFPDANIVCLLRDPAQSIPSMISYISKVS